MRTHLTDAAEEAAGFIQTGQLAAFPTETVYGLGADALDDEAVRAIFAAKGRPSDNPLIVHVAAPDEVTRVAASVPPAARCLLDHFFPGPLTLVLPRHERVPDVVTAGLSTVGVRMPNHELARRFLESCGTPVAAPSANRSGRPSPTTWQAVLDDLGGRIDCILRGPPTPVGLESTVVDCTDDAPLVLRAGALTLERLREVVPSTRLAAGANEAIARSPGTRHRHYAPDARVILIDDPAGAVPDADNAFIGLHSPADSDAFGRCAVHTDVEAYARHLFAFFRECDAAGVHTIFCERVEPTGLGLALVDRIHRAGE